MTITYMSNVPTESGVYLVRVDEALDVAEFDSELEMWMLLGSDYDIWSYSEDSYSVEVIKKLDLEELAKQ